MMTGQDLAGCASDHYDAPEAVVTNGRKAMPVQVDSHRLLDKLDDLQSSISDLARDQARVQGTQEGLKIAIETLTQAVGDVTLVKIATKESAIEMRTLHARIEALEHHRETDDRDARWQSFLTHLASGLLGGGAFSAVFQWFHS